MLILGIADSQTPAAFKPTDVANCKLWLDAADTSSISVSGTDVTQWNDKSGNAYHFTQGTAANRPQSGTRTLNSKNVIDFDGTNDHLVSNQAASVWKFLHDTSKSTIFWVGLADAYTNATSYYGNCDSSNETGAETYHSAGNSTCLYLVNRGVSGTYNSNGSSPTLTAGTAYYITIKVDPGNATASERVKWYRNGANETANNVLTNSASTSDPTNTLYLGASRNSNSGTTVNFLNGYFGEVIMYSGALSAGDVTKVQNYLSAKWAL